MSIENDKKNIQAMVEAGEVIKYSKEYFSLFGKLGRKKLEEKYSSQDFSNWGKLKGKKK